MDDAERRGDEGVGRDYDLVALLDAGCDQGQGQGGRPGGDPDAMAGAAELGELGLERGDLAAEHEPAVLEHVVECRAQPVDQRGVVSLQVHERDLRGGSRQAGGVHRGLLSRPDRGERRWISLCRHGK